MLQQLWQSAQRLTHQATEQARRWFAPGSTINAGPDLTVREVDLIYDPATGLFDAYYFHLIEREGDCEYPLHKVVKILALDFVPLEAREQLTILEKMRSALRGLHEAQVDFVYLVAGIFQPVYLGITQCYGVIGYDPASREVAAANAERAMGALRSALANFEQSRLKRLSRTEVDWIRQAFLEMRFGLVGLGHPDPSRTARAMAQTPQQRGRVLDEFTLEQNEILYRGMAMLGEEFLNVVMAYRVTPQDIYDLQVRTAREASRWASMERGTKGIHLGLGIPLILSGALGHTVGTNYGESQQVGVADSEAHATSHSQGVGVGHTVTHGEAHTTGEADSVTVTDSESVSHGTGQTDGTAHTDSKAHTESQATTVSDGTAHSVGSTWSHSESQSTTQPNGIGGPLQGLPVVGGILQSVSGGSLGGGINANAHGGIPGNTLDGGLGGKVDGSVNFSTGQHSEGVTDTVGGFESTTHSHSESSTHGSADTVGQADTKSHADSTSETITQGHAVSRGHTTMRSDTVSKSEGDSISLGESVGETESKGRSVSRGLGQAEGRSLGEVNALGVGTGLSPNVSLSKTYQWEDHAATLIANLLRGQEQLLNDAAVEGAFLVDNYYFCRTERGRQALAALYAQAFRGNDAVTPAQTRLMGADEFEYLRNRAMTFTPSTRRETQQGLLETYRDSTFLTPLRLAAYTAVGLVEAGRAQTVQERIPPFAFNPHLQGEVVVGHQVMFETGEATMAPCRLSRNKMAHIGVFADSGAGKSVLATWLEYQIATQWQFRVVILDFGRGHRSLMKVIDPREFDLYGLDESSPRPIRWNPLQIGRRILPQTQLEQTCQIIAAAGRMGQRQYGFMWQTLRELYLEYGVLTFDDEVQYPEKYAKEVKGHPNTPKSQQRMALALVSEREREIVNAERTKRNEPPLPAGAVFLHSLPREDLQLIAVERSKQVDLSMWYDRLELVQSARKAGTPDHTALEGVLHRLRPFRYGALARMYGSGEGSIAIEELAYPYGVAVLEGGTLAEVQKAMILGLAAFHIYENSIEKRKETMETAAQHDEHPMLLVLEEAHKIINGVSEHPTSEASQSSGVISVPLWENLARDGRKYNIHYMLIGQSPASFPEPMLTSCGIIASGTLKGDDDRRKAMSLLARSTMGFEDNAYLRFLSRMPRAWMIWKTAISMDRKDIEPLLIETILLPVDREPSDSEVAEHFRTWTPFKENLKQNGNGNGHAGKGHGNGNGDSRNGNEYPGYPVGYPGQDSRNPQDATSETDAVASVSSTRG